MDQTTSISPAHRQTRPISPQTMCRSMKQEETTIHLRQKIRKLQQANRRAVLKIANMDKVIRELRQTKNLSEPQINDLITITGPNKEILKRQIINQKSNCPQLPYSDELKAFALTLHFYSPRAYCYVRSVFDSCLPNPTYLRSWYSKCDGDPGFTEESFKSIRALATNSCRPIYVNMVFDEMAIKSLVEYNVSSGTSSSHSGYVDMGFGIKSDEQNLASQVLVFILTCINMNWKVPIGYFLVKGTGAEMKASLVRTALVLCQEANIHVVGLTFDGAKENLSMARILGCNFDDLNNLRTNFNFAGPTVCYIYYLMLATI